VADLDNFIKHAGMIQFVAGVSRVRMDIDPDAASRARLRVSAKLLAPAQAVTETAGNANN